MRTGRALAQPFFSGNPFSLGVASGDPLPDGVVLWTRLAPDPLAEDGSGGLPPETYGVRWEVAEDEAFAKVVRRGAVEAGPELGHSVHVEVDGLQPGRGYFYRFRAGPEISPVGRTKTAPAPNAPLSKLSFALASCQAWAGGRYAAYRNMAQEDLDLVVHVGDYIYEGRTTRSLADFRKLHARYKTSPDLQAAHAAFPFVATFDDHEVDNNWAGDIPQDNTANFLELRANAFQAYYEHLPLRTASKPQGPDIALYRRLTFGDLAEFNVLDTRQYRSDQADGRFIAPRDPDSLAPSQTMTGEEQQRWLFDNLDRSTARWNILAQQTIVAQYDYDTGEGVSINHDQWDGYVAARKDLLGFLQRKRPSNPVVVSGDWHSNWVNDLKVNFDDPGSETVATEFVGTSVSSGCGWRGQVEAALEENPHVKFFNGEYRGYVRCTLTPESWQSDLRVVTSAADPSGPAYTLATFAVANGVAGARRLDGGGDGIVGTVTDKQRQEPLAGVAVEARRPSGEMVVTTTTDGSGQYRLLVQPGTYQVVAMAGSYRTASQTVEVSDDSVSGADFALEPVVVAAGTGKRIGGPVSQGSTEDIVMENAMLAMTLAAVSEDGQLPGATKGKPIDMAIRGRGDQVDWINLPYASAAQPQGTESWQQLTVRNDDVRVVEVTPERAVVRTSGSSTDFPQVAVTTTYTVRPDQEWVTAESVYVNGGSESVAVWVGDALDHDGAGQRSGVAGHGTITTPYGSPREYVPSEPWMGMTGNDAQTYGLIYDDGYTGLTAYGNGNYIMSRLSVELPAGGSCVLRRGIVAVDNGGASDPFRVLADLYRRTR
ncbi:MAG: alkaline phosphatase D family protein [Actinomycetota bacterium]|nr:alkaline phosphatase D family protein [Actinomycetota bacterium]MDQ3574206.1 alkaline phosphatase D family protein [Actinomycetota bacterium]